MFLVTTGLRLSSRWAVVGASIVTTDAPATAVWGSSLLLSSSSATIPSISGSSTVPDGSPDGGGPLPAVSSGAWTTGGADCLSFRGDWSLVVAVFP